MHLQNFSTDSEEVTRLVELYQLQDEQTHTNQIGLIIRGVDEVRM